LPLDWLIAKYRNVFFSGKGQIKRRFGFRLIDAWEDFAGVMAFELSGEQLFLLAIVLEVAWVETMHRVGNGARKSNHNNMLTGWRILECYFKFVIWMECCHGFSTVDQRCFDNEIFGVKT